jgi:hypothetical protein
MKKELSKLEMLVEKGFKSKISSKSHREIFDILKLKYKRKQSCMKKH